MYDEMHLLLKKIITNDKCRKTRWVVGGGDGEGDLDGVAGGGGRGGRKSDTSLCRCTAICLSPRLVYDKIQFSSHKLITTNRYRKTGGGRWGWGLRRYRRRMGRYVRYFALLMHDNMYVSFGSGCATRYHYFS